MVNLYYASEKAHCISKEKQIVIIITETPLIASIILTLYIWIPSSVVL